MSIWIGDRTIVSVGTSTSFEPGVGPDRYQRTLAQLRANGAEVALCSFTFDPLAGGSVVEFPTTITSELAPGPKGESPKLLDDGIGRWDTGFDSMSRAIADGVVEKVVLARQVNMALEAPVNRSHVVQRLRSSNPSCYVFDIEGLVGASPELLTKVDGGRLTTNVLAGTSIEEEGLETEKTRTEHELAATSALDALSLHLDGDPLVVSNTTTQGVMRHAGTTISGDLKQGHTIAGVLSDLHPTAAVAGVPKDNAMRLIRESEPPRDRYAGPVGWMDSDGNGEFAIALRCGLFTREGITLYAGAGLVAGSDRNEELEETQLKLQPMFDALGYIPRD